MSKNVCIAGLIIALSPWAVNAKSHKVVTLTAEQQVAEAPVFASRWLDSFTVSHIESSELVVQWYRRYGNSFRAASNTPVDLSLLSLYQDKTNAYQLHDVTMDLENTYVLTQGLDCQDDICESQGFLLTAHDMRGTIVTDHFAGGMLALDLDSCDNAPELLRAPQGVWVFNGCGQALKFDPQGQQIVSTTIADWQQGDTVTRAPWYQYDPEGITPVEQAKGWWLGRWSEHEMQAIAFGADGKKRSQSTIALPDKATHCHWVAAEQQPGIGCLVDNSVTVTSLLEPQGFTTYAMTPRLNEPEGQTLSGLTDWSAIMMGDHVFIGQAQKVLEPSSDEGETPSHEDWRIGNYERANATRYQAFSAGPLATEHLARLGSHYELDPTGYYAAALVMVGESEWAVSVYDALPIDEGPYWLANIGGTFGSNQEVSQSLLYEDDNVAYQDILLREEDVPVWASITQDAVPYQMAGHISHGDVGLWPVRLLLGDSEEETGNFVLSSNFNVVLSGFQVLFYEPTLFERLEVDESVPLTDLIRSLRVIDILEDTPFKATLSLSGRETDEVVIDTASLPDFLTWDPSTLTLSGTPAQEDVGVHEHITVLVDDIYAPVNEETGLREFKEILLPLQVIEVDDLFEVRSSGEGTVDVGETYLYQLDLFDEETPLNKMNVTLSTAADWLSYDKETRQLSGVPKESDAGRVFLVQLTIQDSGGHMVIQSFNVTVNALPKKEGGAMSWLGVLVFTLVIWRRRKEWHS